MNSPKTLRNILLACGLGGAIASGCVITTGSVDCEVCNDSPLCHNHTAINPDTGDEACYCDANYTWEDTNDPANLECERIPTKPGSSNCVEPNSYVEGSRCKCDPGYIWCVPEDDNDLTCCPDSAQDTIGGTDTDGDSMGSGTDTDDSAGTATDTADTDDTTTTTTTGQNTPPPDEDCTVDGLRACSNDDPDNVQGSTAWACLSGAWEEINLEEECLAEGSDFAYGCYDSGSPETGVVTECGTGPGTDCTDADDACMGTEVLNLCIWGKLTTVNCAEACGDTSLEITWEFGECIEGMAFCQCCDDPVDNACDCDGGGSSCEGA